MNLGLFQIIELIAGLLAFWVGTFLVSKNPKSTYSWVAFFFLLGAGIIIYTDPLLVNTRTYNEYVFWQKITDIPLFIMPVLMVHLAMISHKAVKQNKTLLILLYILGIAFSLLDFHRGLILREDVIRFANYKVTNGFGPGVLLIPYVVFTVICFTSSIIFYSKAIKKGYRKYIVPIIGSSLMMIAAIYAAFSFYFFMPKSELIMGALIMLGVLFYIYSIVRYQHFVDNERNQFDKTFLYKTIGVFGLIVIYLLAYTSTLESLGFSSLLFIIILMMLVIFSHSIYDWLDTYINDLVYNPASGLSVVKDDDVYQTIRYYSKPERLENSPLLQLRSISDQTNLSIDTLRGAVKDAVEYFKPDDGSRRRTKRNLKYHMLKMIAFDEAEEGQILWELGFDEYPVRIMNNESRDRKPLFQTSSPSDYTYTSRNAYLALKKEAIHDVTWRISYLEKLTKK
jgi:hypothetical protein